MISLPDKYVQSFVYVDCGARGETYHPFISAFPGVKYLGFEVDEEECVRLQARAEKGYTYFPTAVGRSNEVRPFYVTKNPACSSFLKPNFLFLDQFLDLGGNFEIQKTIDMPTVSLDEYLSKSGISSIDFIELDTQGTELEILQGAENLLKNSVLGLKIEAEFAQFYEDQPLFSEIDAYVRSCGFVLFDLSRYHYRRKIYPRELQTRGQTVYGHALYLKDYHLLSKSSMFEKVMKLSMIADYYGFWDYAYVANHYLSSLLPPEENGDEIKVLASHLKYYENVSMKKNGMKTIVQIAKRLHLTKMLGRMMRFFEKVSSAYLKTVQAGKPFWVD
jgi:FkbM family methyltransferase